MKLKSSNSDFSQPIPSRFARGAYISSVSRAIFFLFSCERYSSVRMLWSLSANFIRITLISCAIARNIFLKFSAYASALGLSSILLSFVRLSTRKATSSPNSAFMSSAVVSVSSIVSCKRPAAMVVVSMHIFVRTAATARGCSMKGAP